VLGSGFHDNSADHRVASVQNNVEFLFQNFSCFGHASFDHFDALVVHVPENKNIKLKNERNFIKEALSIH
jgi:hypothetical protein